MDLLMNINSAVRKEVHIDPNKEKVTIISFTGRDGMLREAITLSIYELEKILYHAKQRVYEYEERSLNDDT